MRARGEGRSNDGSEIVRIFDAVEKNDQSFASVTSALVRRGENAFERGWGARSRESDDALMILRIGKTIELAAVFESDRDVPRTRELDYFLDACVLTAARNQNAIERAARVQGFANSVDAGELIHRGDSLQAVVPS
jgi:hypothetical protein